VVISGFEWDDSNVSHIARHRFSPDEVEEVFDGDYKVRRARQGRYVALGETLGGRLAFVVFSRLAASESLRRAIWTLLSGVCSAENRY
jgi:uncharacterized DUF497 family protein